jgi:hypothetical protein
MDNFPLQNGDRIGIETAADVEESDGESDHDNDMMLDENEVNPNDNDVDEGAEQVATEHLGSLKQLLLEQKSARVIRHLTDSSEDRASKHQRALTQATRPLYFAIGHALGISLPARGSKLELHNTILTSVRPVHGKSPFYRKLIPTFQITQNPHMVVFLRSLIPAKENDETHSAVLGKDVLEVVWSDMKKAQLPSWISPAPHNWGTPTRGKLSADNWRVVCTIHLPITLIWLWRDETGRKRQLLENFMDLVTAVRLASILGTL